MPSSAEMWSDIERRRAALAQRYVDSTRHTIQVDYVNYQIELSQLCGCKPNLRESIDRIVIRVFRL